MPGVAPCSAETRPQTLRTASPRAPTMRSATDSTAADGARVATAVTVTPAGVPVTRGSRPRASRRPSRSFCESYISRYPWATSSEFGTSPPVSSEPGMISHVHGVDLVVEPLPDVELGEVDVGQVDRSCALGACGWSVTVMSGPTGWDSPGVIAYSFSRYLMDQMTATPMRSTTTIATSRAGADVVLHLVDARGCEHRSHACSRDRARGLRRRRRRSCSPRAATPTPRCGRERSPPRRGSVDGRCRTASGTSAMSTPRCVAARVSSRRVRLGAACASAPPSPAAWATPTRSSSSPRRTPWARSERRAPSPRSRRRPRPTTTRAAGRPRSLRWARSAIPCTT